jgi:hypothetical protein
MRTHVTPRRGARAFVALFALAVPACSSDVPMQKTVAVTGRVLLDGRPVEGLDVRFIPTDPTNFKLQETPLGRTDADGRFTLTTYYTGDGAPKGEYLVAVAYPDQVADESADETQAAVAAARARKAPGRKKFPAVYQVPQKSGLKATVDKAGELPAFELSSTAK